MGIQVVLGLSLFLSLSPSLHYWHTHITVQTAECSNFDSFDNKTMLRRHRKHVDGLSTDAACLKYSIDEIHRLSL